MRERERERKIYSKKMRIRKVQIKEDKGTKLYVKLKPSKRNMYRQYLVITSKLK